MDTPLVKRAYNLGLKAVPNFLALTEDQVAYYEVHLDELPSAIARGFVLPPPPAVILAPEQTLDWWIVKAEEFSKKHLGVEINLRDRFVIPTDLPWDNVIPVFDPGSITNRDVIKKALKGLKLNVYEEVDVMKYAGAEAGKESTLHFIENSVRPNKDSMNLSPNQLRETGKNYLRLRGYGLAMALYHFATREYLDSETFTWFPEDRLPDGGVADGYWFPSYRKVGFYWGSPYDRYSSSGARVAMPVPLRA